MPGTEPTLPTWSLRNRLLVALAAVLAVLVAGGVTAMHGLADQASQRLYDDSLRQTATLLAQLASHEAEEHGEELGETLLQLETQAGPYQLHYQVWTGDRHKAFGTPGSPEEPYLPIHREGFGWTTVNGEQWRAYAMTGPGTALHVQVAESLAYRSELPHAIFVRMAVAMVVLLALGIPLIAWVLHRGFAGVQRVALEVGQRPATDLRRVDGATLPREVLPLIDALNRMLGKLRGLLENERRFTADAAHELRTPLAAIRINAQLLKGARTPEAVQEGATDLIAGVDRSTRLVEQLLALARLDTGSDRRASFAPVDLGSLIADQAPEQEHIAARRGTRMVLQPEAIVVDGDHDLLAVLLRNLVDNAIRYGGTQGTVTVACAMAGNQAELSVSDTGPGVPESERARIFERFHRVEGTGEFGSGLGLSIVQRIADLHGARVQVEDGAGGRGARFVVRFPPAAARGATP